MKIKKGVALLCATVIAFTFMMAPVLAAHNTEYPYISGYGNVEIYYETYLVTENGKSFFSECYAEWGRGAGIDTITAELYDINGNVQEWTLAYGSTQNYLECSTNKRTLTTGPGLKAQGTFKFQVPKMTKTLTDSYGSSSESMPSIKTTESGKTYGSAYMAIVEPDLIGAVGINGQTGYCLREDLRADYQSSTLVPVYDLDGVVIDMFEITVIR